MAWKEGFQTWIGLFSLAVLSACAQQAPSAVTATKSVVVAPKVSPDEAGLDAQVAVASYAAGKQLYTSYCARCHGVDMVNQGTSFDLRQFPISERARFEHSVTYGLRAMPAWGSLLKSGDLQNLWVYVTNGRRAE